jgi:hypothetical protein
MYHLNISNQVFSNLPIVRRATGEELQAYRSAQRIIKKKLHCKVRNIHFARSPWPEDSTDVLAEMNLGNK